MVRQVIHTSALHGAIQTPPASHYLPVTRRQVGVGSKPEASK